MLLAFLQVLEDIYSEWSTLFDKDIIHLGGDELSRECWKDEPAVIDWIASNAANITDMDDKLIHLWWTMFEKRAEERMAKHYGAAAKVVLWSSGLTKRANTYLDPKKHIIQVSHSFIHKALLL
jgi:hexosaminidase